MRKTGLLLLLMLLIKQFAFGQGTITGTVTSADDGLGVIGAFVVVKGTTSGTITDMDGKYTIKVQPGATLMYSFVGLKSQEIIVGDQTTIDVVLKADVFKMEEVIVAGVASGTPKRKLSVSVNKVGTEELEAVPAMSAATALQGKVAGITIVNSSGTPGQSAGIRLRGSTSLLGNQKPLIIVDGIMMEGDLADINVDDISDIQVVKGASASALYGSRAGSGVLVITTKRGNLASEGTTEIKIRNEYGISNLIKEIKVAEHHANMLADDWQQQYYTKYAGVTYPDNYKGGGITTVIGARKPDFDHYSDNPFSFVKDMQKEIFPTGNFYTNYISVATNNGKSSLLTSFENSHNSGIVFAKNGSYRQNFRVNVDQKLYENFKLSLSSLVSQTQLDLPNGGDDITTTGGENSVFADVLLMNPDIDLNMNSPVPTRRNMEKYYYQPDKWGLGINPKYSLYYEKRSTKRNSIMQNYSMNYKTFRWLELNADYSFEKRYLNFTLYDPPGFMGSSGAFAGGVEEKTSYESLSQTFQTTANINRIFGNFTTKAKLNCMVENFESDQLSAQGVDFLTGGIKNLGGTKGKATILSHLEKTIAINYSAILDVDYKGKYIASMLYRYDGSSLFGANNRWNPYYRISLAYLITEDFKIPQVQELKLRAAVGTSGQRPSFEYQYETFTVFNGVLYPNTAGNKNLKPSETRETEIAVNTQFLGSFEAELIYSNNKTTRAFVPVPLSPAKTGFPAQWQNAATLAGTSFEWTLGAQVIKQKELSWKINFTFDKVSQKISELNVPPFQVGPDYSFFLKQGEPFGIMYGYDWVKTLDQMKNQVPQGKTISDFTVNSDGYVIVKGTEGTYNEKPILLDQNNDLSADFVKIADMNPDFNMSFSSTFTWKKLSLSMMWNWKNGGDIYNKTKQRLFFDWKAGENDQYGKPGYKKKSTDYYYEFYNKAFVNSHFVEDASFLKLRELSLYYTFDNNFFSKIKAGFFKDAKLGILARNVLTYTKYTGWDPEVSTGSDLTNYVYDDFNYPNFRTITMSLELKF
jgi:TonB-linked SusC/RagA family outer membrane protein